MAKPGPTPVELKLDPPAWVAMRRTLKGITAHEKKIGFVSINGSMNNSAYGRRKTRLASQRTSRRANRSK